MKIKNNFSLLKHNTFKIEAKAKHFVQVNSIEDILELLDTEIYQNNKKYFLGAGSNTVFVDDFDGLVIKINILGKEIISQNADEIIIRAGAGESWVDFVEWLAQNDYMGAENLAYIPSNVGATAVQNVGAYGVEAKDIIWQVDALDLNTREIKTLENSQCNFAYRDSIFKNGLEDDFIITHVTYKLKKFSPDYQFNTKYDGIIQKIEELGFNLETMKPLDFVSTITEIRKNKLPDWKVIGTAGSFFKNPVISQIQRQQLQADFPELKAFPAGNEVKLSAGQLIDLCGFKGAGDGKVGTYKNHALILINEGTATGQDVLNFARRIQKSVQEKFGVELEPEAIFVE